MKPKKSSRKSSAIFSLKNFTKRLKAKPSPKNDNYQTTKIKSTSLTYIKPYNTSTKKVFVEIEMKTFKAPLPVMSDKKPRSPSDSPKGTLEKLRDSERKWLIASTEDFRNCAKRNSCLSKGFKNTKKPRESSGFKKNKKVRSKPSIDLKDQKRKQSKSHRQRSPTPIYPVKKEYRENCHCSENVLHSDLLNEILQRNRSEVVKIESDYTFDVESDLARPHNPFNNNQCQNDKCLNSPIKKRRSFKRFFSRSRTSVASKGRKNQLDRRNSSPHPKCESGKFRMSDDREMQTFFAKGEVESSESANVRGDSPDFFSHKTEKDSQSLHLLPEVSPAPVLSSPVNKASKSSILRSIKSCFKTQETSDKMSSNDTMMTPIGTVTTFKDDTFSNRKAYKRTLKHFCGKKDDAKAIDLCDLEFLYDSEDSLFKPGEAKTGRCSYPDCRDFSNNSKLIGREANQSASSNQVHRNRKNSKASTESRGDGFFDRKSGSSVAKNAQSVKSIGQADSSHKNEFDISRMLPVKPSVSEIVQSSTLIKPIRKMCPSKCGSRQGNCEIDNLETSGPIFENFFAAEKKGHKFYHRETIGKSVPSEFENNALSTNEYVNMLAYQDPKPPTAKCQNKGVLKKNNLCTPPIIKKRKVGLMTNSKNKVVPNITSSTDAFHQYFATPDTRDCRTISPVSETQSLFSWNSKQSKKVLHVPNTAKCGRGRGRPLGLHKVDKKLKPETKSVGKQSKEHSRKITKVSYTPEESLKEVSHDTIRSVRSNQVSSIGKATEMSKNSSNGQDSRTELSSEIMKNLERWRERNSPCFLHELMQATEQKPIAKTGKNMEIIMEEKFTRSVSDKEVAIVFTMCLEDYRILGKITDGNFGKILFAKSISMDKKFAMKMIEKNYISGTPDERIVDDRFKCKFVPNIVNVCPFFVHLMDIFQTENHFFYVMEFMEYCNLELILIQSGSFEYNQIRFYSAGILLAIKYLHEQKLIHRNLKLENVLVDGKGYPRLSDFGRSCFRIQSGSRFEDVYMGSDQEKWTNIQYMAPEVLTGQLHNHMVDFWSLAVCIVYMLTGQLQKNWRYFVDYLGEINSMYGQTIMNLLKSMTKLNPSLRLGCGDMKAMEIMNHPFFDTIDWPVYSVKSYSVPMPNKHCRTGHSVMSKELYDELATSIGLEKNYKAAIVSVAPSAPPLNREIDLATSQFKTSVECRPDGKCIKFETIACDAHRIAAEKKSFSFEPSEQKVTILQCKSTFDGKPTGDKVAPLSKEQLNLLKPMEVVEKAKNFPEPPSQNKENFDNCLTQLLERMQSELHLYHRTVGPLPLVERKKVDEKEVLDRLMKLHRSGLCSDKKNTTHKRAEIKSSIKIPPRKSHSASTLESRSGTESSVASSTRTTSSYSSSATVCKSDSRSGFDSSDTESMYNDNDSSSQTGPESVSVSTDLSSIMSTKRSKKCKHASEGKRRKRISFADEKKPEHISKKRTKSSKKN